MPAFISPLSFLITCVSGWINEHQRHVIDYLTEENRVLHDQIGARRLLWFLKILNVSMPDLYSYSRGAPFSLRSRRATLICEEIASGR